MKTYALALALTLVALPAFAGSLDDARKLCIDENTTVPVVLVSSDDERTAATAFVDELEAAAWPGELPAIVDTRTQTVPARWRGLETATVSAYRNESGQAVAAGVLRLPATVGEFTAFWAHANKRHGIPDRAKAAIRTGALLASWGEHADGELDPIASYTARNRSLAQDCALYGCQDCLDNVAAICASGQCSSGRRGLFGRRAARRRR